MSTRSDLISTRQNSAMSVALTLSGAATILRLWSTDSSVRDSSRRLRPSGSPQALRTSPRGERPALQRVVDVAPGQPIRIPAFARDRVGRFVGAEGAQRLRHGIEAKNLPTLGGLATAPTSAN